MLKKEIRVININFSSYSLINVYNGEGCQCNSFILLISILSIKNSYSVIILI